MSEPNENLDLHLTQLVQWIVHTVGAALLVGCLIGGVVSAVGVAAESGITVAIGGALGGLVFAFMLFTADAPLPADVGDEG